MQCRLQECMQCAKLLRYV